MQRLIWGPGFDYNAVGKASEDILGCWDGCKTMPGMAGIVRGLAAAGQSRDGHGAAAGQSRNGHKTLPGMAGIVQG